MKITLRGVRGSIPTTSPDTKEYGGNTSCVEVESGDWLLVLDAGTGIQNVTLPEPIVHQRVDILLTHFHIDHIQGLSFFKPLFDPNMEVHIWGPASFSQSLRSRLGRYLSPPFFPMYFRDLPCRLVLHEIENSSFTIGPFTILSRYIIHNGPTLGFRVQDASGVMAYLPDHEPALGLSGLLEDVKWLSGSDLALGADVLIHDAQYTLGEYKDKAGWGHSAMEDAIRFAALTDVKHLFLTHHDPSRTDQQLKEIYKGLKAAISSIFPYELSVEGMKITL